MPWFKVDDTLPLNAKVVAAGNAAMGLWVRAGAWSAQQLTDGFVPAHMAAVLGTRAEARRLVDAGLWSAVDGGYAFHQWGERQPSGAQVIAQRKADAARQQLSRDPELRDAVRKRDGGCCRYCGREVKFNDRRGSGGGTYDHVIPDGGTTLDNLVVACRGCNARKGRRTPEEAGMSLSSPRDVTRSESRSALRPDPTRPDHVTTSVVTSTRATPDAFDEFWSTYPRREGKQAARRAWDKATKNTPASTITAAAARYRDDPNRDPAYTAHASTWLTRGSWDDDPLPPRRDTTRPNRDQLGDEWAARGRRLQATLDGLPDLKVINQ